MQRQMCGDLGAGKGSGAGFDGCRSPAKRASSVAMTVDTTRYVPPPERCEPLAAIVARCGGSMRVIGPESASGPVEAVARLPGGRVFGAGIVLAPDGRSVARDVSLDFGRPDDTHWLLDYEKMPPPVRLAGSTAVIATALGDGYCHWLLDELPRWLLLEKSETAGNLVAHTETPYARAALTLGGWSGTVVAPGRRRHFACEELIVPTFPGWTGRATRRQLELIGGFVEPLHRSGTIAGERIYLSRATARRRRVTNEAEGVDLLAARGFGVVRPEELAWPEQINAFRHAKIVVAPHGAGLANLVFCAPGTRVIELFNPAYVNDCFRQIAELRGLDYRAVVAPGEVAASPEPRANRLEITADLAGLRAALASAGGSG